MAGRRLRLVLLGLLSLAVAAGLVPSSQASGGRLIWHDEFSGAAGSAPGAARWTYDLGGGGWGNDELETYTRSPANVQLDGHGHLVITARRAADGRITSARIKTQGRFSFRYGTVSARISLPAGKGLWPAFWLLGKSIATVDWPACGEIDVMELLGQDPRTAHGTIHGPGPHSDGGFGAAYHAPTPLTGGFHVYAARWTPSGVTFLVDGHAYETVVRSDVTSPDRWALDQPMFILLNLAVGGSWPGSPNARTPFPARMVVDWVRVTQGA